MRILMINYEFPPLGGGAGNATQNIACELARAGHEVVVLTTWFEGTKEDEVVGGYRVVRVRSKRSRVDRSNVFEMLHYVWRAIINGRGMVEEFRPDTTISFFAVPSGLVAWYFKKRFNIPYIVSLRGGDVPGFLPKNLKWHHRLSGPITGLVWKNATHIVANSEGLRVLADKTAVLYGKKVVMIPNGVNRELFKPDFGGSLDDKVRILFVGRLTEQKGAIYIINSLNQVFQKYPALKRRLFCDLVGDGPLRKSLESRVGTLGLTDNVVFHGWISRDGLPSFYQRANALVLPSSDEGMPNVILEAMASGLPIITTFVPGSEELVVDGKNGMLVEDRTDLVPAILDLVNDREKWWVMGGNSLEQSKEFDWAHIAAGYAKLT